MCKIQVTLNLYLSRSCLRKRKSWLITGDFGVQTEIFRDAESIKHPNLINFGGLGQHNPGPHLTHMFLASQKAAA